MDKICISFLSLLGGKGASGVAVLGDLHEFPIHHLELWGQICFQLAAQPDDVKKEKQKGHISIEVNDCSLGL